MDSIPMLNKDASREMSFDFSPFMRGSEKRDCEVAAPPEVIKKAVERVMETLKAKYGD